MGIKKKWHGRKRGPKWANYVYLRVKLRNPRVKMLGIWNCRKISGSSSWSQHSWGNAVDIGVPSLAYGDQVRNYLKRHPRFNIEHDLWRVPDHFDHHHIDFSPNHSGKPPCA